MTSDPTLKQLEQNYIEVDHAVRQCKAAAAFWLSHLNYHEDDFMVAIARSYRAQAHLLKSDTEIPSEEPAPSSSGKKKGKSILSSNASEATVSALLFLKPRDSRTPKLLMKGGNTGDRLSAVAYLHGLLEVCVDAAAAEHVARAYKDGVGITQELLKNPCVFFKKGELAAGSEAAGAEGGQGLSARAAGEEPPPYEKGAVFDESFLEDLKIGR